MRRREVILSLGGAAASSVSWPMVARAQGDRVRKIGLLLGSTSPDRPDVSAFRQALQRLGWSEGRNLLIEYRWGRGNAANIRKYAEELVALAPDVLLVSGASSLAPMLSTTRTLPIVFTSVADPVGAGFVASLSRPGGNATGFIQLEYSLSGKWLELLKQIAPGVTRALVLRDPTQTAGVGQFAVIQSVASTVGVEVLPVNVRDPDEIESGVAAFARAALDSGARGPRGDFALPNGGLVVTASALTLVHLDRIVALAARLRLPAVYPRRVYVDSGGLISYGFDVVDQFRRAAGYVDRILRGEKPADLPVQAPTKYELVINLKTAKTLGIDVPPTLLARADEVIE